jgi:hypothetical protein
MERVMGQIAPSRPSGHTVRDVGRTPHRWVALAAVAFVVAACSSAAAPTPKIVYVTPQPAVADPAAAPTPRAIAGARAHILTTLTALQEQADAITSASNLGDMEATYAAIQTVNRLVTDELDWLNTQPASVTDVPVIRLYEAKLLAYQPLGQLTLTHFYDATGVDTARQAGRAHADLLGLRPDISAIGVTP